jgi:hypothetical protein
MTYVLIGNWIYIWNKTWKYQMEYSVISLFVHNQRECRMK